MSGFAFYISHSPSSSTSQKQQQATPRVSAIQRDISSKTLTFGNDAASLGHRCGPQASFGAWTLIGLTFIPNALLATLFRIAGVVHLSPIELCG